MLLTRLRRPALLLAVSAGLGLTACGGGGGDSGTPAVSDPNGWNAVTTLKTVDTTVGTGASADAGKPVTVTYTGWLYDVRTASTKGTQFDSNATATGLPLYVLVGAGNVIKGFDQGVQGMKVGGKRTVTMPASLAYGSTGAGNGVIPANAALVFDIELTAVDPNGWLTVTALKTQDTLVGAGTQADTGKTATVAYSGYLYDARVADTRGTKFDAGSFPFKLGGGTVIPGFDAGVQGMRVGGKRTITIPAAQAYGNTGQGSIPGGAALVFDVEVTAVN